MFSWIPVTAQCPYIQYVITSRNCGLCLNVTNTTSVLCTNYNYNSVNAHENRTCIFAVQTEVCGSLIGNRSDYVILYNMNNETGEKSNFNFVGEYMKILQYNIAHVQIILYYTFLYDIIACLNQSVQLSMYFVEIR